MLSKSQQTAIDLAHKLGLKVCVMSYDAPSNKKPHLFGNVINNVKINDFKDFLEIMDKTELIKYIER